MSGFKKMIAAGLLMAIFSTPALAQSQDQNENNKAIAQLGVQTSGVAYFGVNGGFALNCEWGYVYVDITSAAGRVAYAELLAAKIAGKQLSRIDYTQASSGGMCMLSLVEIQQ